MGVGVAAETIRNEYFYFHNKDNRFRFWIESGFSMCFICYKTNLTITCFYFMFTIYFLRTKSIFVVSAASYSERSNRNSVFRHNFRLCVPSATGLQSGDANRVFFTFFNLYFAVLFSSVSVVMTPICLLPAVSLALLSFRTVSSRRDVLELGDADFEYLATGHETMLVKFYAPW